MSGQQRIVVDYDLLGVSVSSLRSIGDEFENAARIKDDLVGYLGSDDIADAMGDFSGNWDRKRLDVTAKIKTTEGFVRSVMASFSEQDRQGAKFDLTRHSAPTMTTTETAP
ncbi:MAG: hypothetical protein QOF35_463 [Actinomycetota bacterium]|jgi:hypothetical protein|nr:hypothetical protein [Actinomycetota bacterium]